jgi:RHS repeat-associated protein
LDQIYCEIILKPDSTLDDLCIIFDPVSNKQTIAIRDIPDQPRVNGYNGECGEPEMTIHAATPIVGNGEDISHNWYNADGSVVAEGTFEVERPDEYEVHVTKWQNTFSNGESYSVTTINGDACESDPVEFTIDLGTTPSVALTAFACNPSNIVPTQLTIKMENAPVGSTFDIYRHEINSSGHDEYYSLGATSSSEFVYDNYYLHYTNEIYVVMNDPNNCDLGTYRSVFVENTVLEAPDITGYREVCPYADLQLTNTFVTNDGYNWYDVIGNNIGSTATYSQEDIIEEFTVYATYNYAGYFGVCESPRTTVNVKLKTDPPLPPFVPSVTKKCGTGDFEIVAYGDFDSYQWYDQDDVEIGDGTNKYTINLSTINNPITLKVKGLLNNNCESETTVFSALAVDNCENYIHETTVYTAGNQDENSVKELGHEFKTETWNYFDGIGRGMQTVNQQFIPLVGGATEPKDFVTPIIYDEFGREEKSYLPYADAGSSYGFLKPNPVNTGDPLIDYYTSPQYLFYESHFNTPTLERDYPYAEKQFESSPLNRVLEEAAPGDYWHFGAKDKDERDPTNAQTKYDYTANGTDEVRLWTVSSSELVDNRYLKLESTDNYLLEKLWLNVVTDENGVMTCEYKDLQDRVILKKGQVADLAEMNQHDGWACTYYIYDDLSNLRYVIPPQAVQEMLDAGDWTLVNDPLTGGDFIDNWLFYYEYDSRQRMTLKKVPGADPVYMVYDNRNRQVLTQDGNQRISHDWLFTKYDELNRPVMTGVYTHSEAISQGGMQIYVNDRVGTTYETETYSWHESRTEDINSLHGYDNSSFPKTDEDDSPLKIHSVTYYDNYSFLGGGGYGKTYFDDGTSDYSYNNTYIPCQYPNANLLVRGQVTGGKIRILDPDGTEQYLNTVTYFDDRYRTIQNVSKNHFGEIDWLTTCYEGITETIQENYYTSTLSGSPTIHRVFVYDHEQRLLSIEHSIDGEPPVKILENYYNELGELVKKDLHQQDGNDPWQSIDYQYNMRGWLTHINDATLSQEPSDLFGMELYYADGFDVPMYNGNISGVKWKSAIDDDRMAYGYTYDRLNRFVSADYVKGTNPSSWQEEGYYNVEIRGAQIGESGYDLNGNICSLKRYGFVDNHQSAIDVLTYDYANGNSGNQLLNVSDGGADAGFKDGTVDIHSDGVDYQYDANGNMKTDDNKEIENIEYNFLNLPMVVDLTEGRKIEYIFDASGIKLSQRVFEDESQPATKVTDYLGEMVYETKDDEPIELQYIQHEEGRIAQGPDLDDPDWIPDPPNWEYQYFLKDHLGNTRITFGAPQTDEYNLTMEVVEPENRIIEDREFENVTISEDNRLPDHNHTPVVEGITPNPEYVVKLDGSTKIIGPAKSLKVLPGDEINIDVWAKYLHVDEGYDPSVAVELLLSGFFGAFINYGSEMLISQGYVDGSLLGSLADIPTGKNHTGVPEAYINYILFDKNYQVIEENNEKQAKKLRISNEGRYPDLQEGLGTHEHLIVPTININQEGYIYIYLSNHTPGSEVIFDDLRITHTKTNIIQKNDYYPFGLSIDALTSIRDNSVHNNFLYNGKELISDFGMNMYDFGARHYQPDIGRWFVSDPKADQYSPVSPYTYALNTPVIAFDPDGEEVYFSNQADTKRVVDDLNRLFAVVYGSPEPVFKVISEVKSKEIKNPDYGLWDKYGPGTDPPTITVNVSKHFIATNNESFNWSQDIYTKGIWDLINAKSFQLKGVITEIDGDKAKHLRQGGYNTSWGFVLGDHLLNYGDEGTITKYGKLGDRCCNGKGFLQESIGFVTLHELVYHKTLFGKELWKEQDKKTGLIGNNKMRRFFGVPGESMGWGEEFHPASNWIPPTLSGEQSELDKKTPPPETNTNTENKQ